MVVLGVIHGKRIELESDAGFPEGQRVRVLVLPALDIPADARREAILRSAGAWSEDGRELDAYLEWNRTQRKESRRSIE